MKNFLRKEEKFNNIEELKTAMNNDKILTQTLLNKPSK